MSTPAKTKPMKAKEWDTLNVQIEHAGRAITLPAEPGHMPIQKAMEALARKLADEEQTFRVHEIIDAYPHDAAVAFVKAMANLYGWASPKSTMGFFGPNPPTMLSVKTGPRDEDVIQCPMGAFVLPGVDNEVGTVIDEGKFIIHTTVKKKDRHLVLELANETRRIVASESIYKGKALHMLVDDDGDLQDSAPPIFLDVSDTTEADVLFDDNIKQQIDVNILVPMKKTAECRAASIPLKRGTLLEGPFGTGKTLTARMAGSVAVLCGWTFILLDKVQGLRAALEFAKRYAPAVVFAEDIDRIAEVRSDGMNYLINTMDGVLSKNAEVAVILTTNFVEKLDKVILRPGRLDAVISLRAPAAKTVERLIRHYGRELVPEKASLSRAGRELAGQIPASIRECVERAKLAMIGRGDTTLSDSDLVVAAQTMKNHLALLNDVRGERSDAEQLADSLQKVVGNGNAAHLANIEKQLGRVVRSVC